MNVGEYQCLMGAYIHSYTLSLHFSGHFPGGPALAGNRVFPFWILMELRMMQMVLTTGAIRRAKLQSKCHHQHNNAHFSTGQMPFLSPNQQCQSTEWKTFIATL